MAKQNEAKLAILAAEKEQIQNNVESFLVPNWVTAQKHGYSCVCLFSFMYSLNLLLAFATILICAD